MIWPGILPNCALFYALHDRVPPDPAQTNGWSISRYRWFLYVMIGSFVWYWVSIFRTSACALPTRMPIPLCPQASAKFPYTGFS